MNIKIAQNYQWDRFKFINKTLAYLKLPRWRMRCRFPILLLSCHCLVVVLLMEIRAQNKHEYDHILFLYALETE